MFKIIIIGLLFGGQVNPGIGPFISKDACKAVASHVITHGGKAECKPLFVSTREQKGLS